MKVRITKLGIYGADGEKIPVGTEITVKDEPRHWNGRYEVVVPGASDKAVPITNDVAALKKTAQGDARKADVKAAREALEKMGIDWK